MVWLQMAPSTTPAAIDRSLPIEGRRQDYSMRATNIIRENFVREVSHGCAGSKPTSRNLVVAVAGVSERPHRIPDPESIRIDAEYFATWNCHRAASCSSVAL